MKEIKLDGTKFDMLEKFGAVIIQRYESNRDSAYDNWCLEYPQLAEKLNEIERTLFNAKYLPKKQELEEKADALELALKDIPQGTPEYEQAEKEARAAGDAIKDFEDSVIDSPSAMSLWYNKYGTPYISWSIISVICSPKLGSKRSLKECFELATAEEVAIPLNFFLQTWQGKKSEPQK